MGIKPHIMNGVALITGSASGIGRAVAHVFVEEGCTRLILADLDDGGLRTVSDELKALNSDVQTCICICDVSSETDVQKMVDDGVQAFGAIHYAVNNAGVASRPRVKTHELEASAWDRVQNVNGRGAWLCERAEIRQMLKQEPSLTTRTGAPAQRGSIVNLASIFAFATQNTNGAYSSSKASVIGMTKTDAITYAQDGIRVNSVCPGSTLTPLGLKSGTYPADMTKPIPMGRLARSEEIAQGIVFLASERASFITGESLNIDGGSLSYYHF
ncbi:oxidoreductase [Lophiostoma macrostomum CBS 122681]|uniref:Oxidoreductase n=1 Tax=Lophiostoma macrostomum CBS 122681 TaxID=1314788 RepID=A0A6A6SZF5_9PLEO|nr:oxidoreductase [Lophiostoma macrostomum CBS 122681]